MRERSAVDETDPRDGLHLPAPGLERSISADDAFEFEFNLGQQRTKALQDRLASTFQGTTDFVPGRLQTLLEGRAVAYDSGTLADQVSDPALQGAGRRIGALDAARSTNG